MLLRRVLLVALVPLLVPVVGAAPGPDPLQPGDRIPGGCRLGFVFDGAAENSGSVYFITTASCVGPVGSRVSAPGHGAFATVTMRGDQLEPAGDWALLLVDEEMEDEVSAEVRGVSGAPSGGFTTEGDVAPGDVLVLAGGREGTLTTQTFEAWSGDVPAKRPDRGGPVLHEDGRAVGLVASRDGGPTVHLIVNVAASFGQPIDMREA